MMKWVTIICLLFQYSLTITVPCIQNIYYDPYGYKLHMAIIYVTYKMERCSTITITCHVFEFSNVLLHASFSPFIWTWHFKHSIIQSYTHLQQNGLQSGIHQLTLVTFTRRCLYLAAVEWYITRWHLFVSCSSIAREEIGLIGCVSLHCVRW